MQVQQIQAASAGAIAVIRNDSSVSWGYSFGGDSSQVQKLLGVQQVAAGGAFAAILESGAVTWGDP